MYAMEDPPSSSFGSGCEEAAARDREICELVDAFVATAVELSLLQVRQLDIAQQLLAQQGAIWGSVPLWLSQRAGLSGREAKQLCRVAKRLPGLPLIDTAFRGGRLSLDTADVLLKVATPANEAVLLETAGAATGAQLRKIIATFKRIRDHDKPEPDRAEDLRYGSDDESMWVLHARLQPGHGGESEAALRAAKEDLWERGEVGEDGKRPAVSNVDAFLHLCRTYLEGKVTAAGRLPDRFLTVVHVDLTRQAGGDGEVRGAVPNRAQRRAHQRRVAAARGVRRGKREKRGGDGQLVGKVDGRSLDVANRDDIAFLRGIGAIDGNTLERFLCDSVVSIVDHHGVDVTASAPVRLATPAQRQALLALHATCQFPGCGRTQYLQAHHLVDYHPVHGPTALWNLALLCDEHHDQLHKEGWSAALTDDHTLLVFKPNGALLNTGALRTDDATRAPEDAKSDAAGHDPQMDVGQRLHGVGDRMDAWALDTYLHFWLEATAAA